MSDRRSAGRPAPRIVGGWALACIIVATAPPALAAPRLAVVPERVVSGGSLVAYGDGFCPSARCGTVTLQIESDTLAAVFVGPDGRFQQTLRIVRRPGRYLLVARQEDTTATAPFLVTVNERTSAAPDVSPSPTPATRATPSRGRPSTAATPSSPRSSASTPAVAADPAAGVGGGLLGVLLAVAGLGVVVTAVLWLRRPRGRHFS